MGRPRKVEPDDRYDEEALHHDLTPEAIREQSAREEAAGQPGQYDAEVEEPVIELGDLGEREGGGYFESLREEDGDDEE